MSTQAEKEAKINETLLDLIKRSKESGVDIPDITDEDEKTLTELRKKLSPYGRTIEGSGKYVTMSYIPIDENRQKKHLMTGLIGFLYRANDEYLVPEDVKSVPVDEFVKNPDCLNPSEDVLKRETAEQKQKREQNLVDMEKRIIIREFLDKLFTFNPDMHARSAYKPNLEDTARRVVDTPAGLIPVNIELRKSSQFANDVEKYKKAKAEGKKVSELVTEVMPTVPIEYEKIPSADIFKKYEFYLESHHEALIAAVYDLYGLSTQFILAFNAFNMHDSEEEADKFISKHKDELVTTIHKLKTGMWTIVEPFEKVRDSTRFNSDKMLILDGIMKQSIEAEKLYKDMMEKRIEVKRKENEKKEGKRPESFQKFLKTYAPIRDADPESFNRKSAVDPECPPDAVQFNVFKIGEGGTKMTTEKHFTAADSSSSPAMPQKKPE